MQIHEVLNQAGHLYLQDRYAEAEELLKKQLQIFPDDHKIYYNLAVLANARGDFKECTRLCRRSLELVPDFHDARDLLSHQLLRDGHWIEGFEFFEARFQKTLSIPSLNCECPVWDGSEKQNVLVLGEQGLGDTVQFSRLISGVRERNCRVILLAQKELCELFYESKLADEIYLFDNITAAGATADGRLTLTINPEFLKDRHIDAHITIMSLARVLKISPGYIPGRCPFLKVVPIRADIARGVIEGFGEPDFLKVGLAWAGSTSDHPEFQKLDQRRSVPLHELRDFFELKSVTFFSLQKGNRSLDRLEFPGIKALPLSDSYADTAALLLHLDLLITVDTSICHVAGGLGVPVWLMNRYDTCWRWFHDRPDSPWYPTVRVFRQKSQGDWAGIVKELKPRLEELARQRLQRVPERKALFT